MQQKPGLMVPALQEEMQNFIHIAPHGTYLCLEVSRVDPMHSKVEADFFHGRSPFGAPQNQEGNAINPESDHTDWEHGRQDGRNDEEDDQDDFEN